MTSYSGLQFINPLPNSWFLSFSHSQPPTLPFIVETAYTFLPLSRESQMLALLLATCDLRQVQTPLSTGLLHFLNKGQSLCGPKQMEMEIPRGMEISASNGPFSWPSLQTGDCGTPGVQKAFPEIIWPWMVPKELFSRSFTSIVTQLPNSLTKEKCPSHPIQNNFSDCSRM